MLANDLPTKTNKWWIFWQVGSLFLIPIHMFQLLEWTLLMLSTNSLKFHILANFQLILNLYEKRHYLFYLGFNPFLFPFSYCRMGFTPKLDSRSCSGFWRSRCSSNIKPSLDKCTCVSHPTYLHPSLYTLAQTFHSEERFLKSKYRQYTDGYIIFTRCILVIGAYDFFHYLKLFSN